MTPAPRAAIAALLALGAVAPAAGQERAEVRFEVRPSGRGPQRLDVPHDLLSASANGDLADLRLRDAAGNEVQYLLVAPAEEPARWIPAARLRPLPPAKAESGVEIDLGAVRTVAGLDVDLVDAGYLKRGRLEASADGRRWVLLAPELVLFQLPLDPAACGGEACPGELVRREVRFAPAAARYLRLVLDDRRSPRLRPPAMARALLARELAPAPGPTIELPVSLHPGDPGTTRFTLRLPGPHLPVRALLLESSAAHLARKARVLEARLDGGRLAPVELGRATLLQVERDGVRASALRIAVDRPEELELELVIDDGDNAPLSPRVRAELAPLPWIYFESADGEPLEARLGDPDRAAPRYDLEALRPELGRVRTRTAEVGRRRDAEEAAPVPTSAVPEAAGPGAPLDRKAFRFSRPIEATTPPGLSAIWLDVFVLARSDLADLRIAAPDGRQIPYLLERRHESMEVPLEARAGSQVPSVPAGLARRGDTVHVLPIPERNLPASRLVLSTLGRVFSREVRVYAEQDGRAPQLLATGSWVHADPRWQPSHLALELPPLRAARLLVAVNDGDNAPLPIAARMLLPSYRLRFYHPGSALDLLFGADLPAPQYDLALLAPRLRAASALRVELGPAPTAQAEDALASGAGPAPSRGARLAFWIVLGASVVGLLALVARLLTRGGPARPAAGP